MTFPLLGWEDRKYISNRSHQVKKSHSLFYIQGVLITLVYCWFCWDTQTWSRAIGTSNLIWWQNLTNLFLIHVKTWVGIHVVGTTIPPGVGLDSVVNTRLNSLKVLDCFNSPTLMMSWPLKTGVLDGQPVLEWPHQLHQKSMVTMEESSPWQGLLVSLGKPWFKFPVKKTMASHGPGHLWVWMLRWGKRLSIHLILKCI